MAPRGLAPASPGSSAAGAAAERDRYWLARAARLGLRGHGGAEPNPCVGAVIVDAKDTVLGSAPRSTLGSLLGSLLGSGFHRRRGEAHAEIAALADARSRGHAVRGKTIYVTLEPCQGLGRTGPCTEAIIEAGLGEVVVARRDPHPKGRGGLERLAAAGVGVRVVEAPAALRLGAPFAKRVTTGLPWVVAKWAQTLDGRIATGTGDSRWISSPRSRAMVHRERGRVDAILTGAGTALADDPLLTARDCRLRRIARRVLVDPQLRIPAAARLLGSLEVAPLTIACGSDASGSPKAQELRARGVEIVELPAMAAEIGAGGTGPHDSTPRRADLRPLLHHLAQVHEVATLLVEAGPGLLGSLFRQDLVDMAWVFVAPIVMGDGAAPGPVMRRSPRTMEELRLDPTAKLRLVEVRQRGPDAMLLLERGGASPS